MVNSNSKGDRLERELVNAIDDTEGWAVMRAPASGSATERELPDILAGNGQSFYAVEAKSKAGERLYIDGEEITDLRLFARKFGANALIGVRYDNHPWYLIEPDFCHVTDGGNYRVKLGLAESEGYRLEEVLQ